MSYKLELTRLAFENVKKLKSEVSLQSKSLKTFIQGHPDLKALRLSMQNHIDQGWVENLPLFAFKEALKARSNLHPL